MTSLHCSDQQLPVSGDDDLQQVASLQYCLVDNCTIMMIDTGEELDIVYTTDSLIVTTPTDGHTTVIIARLYKELPCLSPTSSLEDVVAAPLIGFLFMGSLIITVSGYSHCSLDIQRVTQSNGEVDNVLQSFTGSCSIYYLNDA